MNIKYFNDFLNYETQGIKAKECINNFILSFESFNEKELWTTEYLPKLSQNSNGRIRNELFENIIFPVLLNGYKNRNIDLTIWLVKLNQNYYQNHRIWEKINYKSSLEIIDECYKINPNNHEVIDLYLELEIERVNFSLHEYPYGILFGNSFASKDECKILLGKVVFINKLDRNKKYSKYINDYEYKIKEYMRRIK
jgi:hypothetical protein